MIDRDDYMPDKLPNVSIAARRVEHTIGQLDSLSILPCVGAQLFSRLIQGQFSPSMLTDIVKSDPALTARILSLISHRGVSLPEERFSLRQALDKLPAHEVRDAVLSVKVLQPFDIDDVADVSSVLFKKDLLLHGLAVACCAKDIAEMTSPQIDSQLAYCAGLLHDIGKLALDDTMPKSFARIVEEAKSAKDCSRAIEQKHLGTEHTVIGKHLAQKWQLPNPIALAIWLHHSETATISQDMPQARIAAVVQLADSIARRSGIGCSGSFDVPVPAGPIAQYLGINIEQLEQIRQNLPAAVEQKSSVLGLDLPDALASFCRVAQFAQAAAARWARRETELSLENSRLQSDSSHLDFTADFLLDINSAGRAVDIAESFATRWQKFYQTGTVCLYLLPSAGSQTLEAVIVEGLSQSRIVSLDVPAETPTIPETIANNFSILNACEHIDWLFEQLDVDFDVNRSKVPPLL
jgi:putative nucleotidyltransferase with HDIG domain